MKNNYIIIWIVSVLLVINLSCHNKLHSIPKYKEISDIQIKQIILTEPLLSYSAEMLTYSKKLPLISDKSYSIHNSPLVIRRIILDNRSIEEDKYGIESIMDTIENTAYSFAYLDDYYYLILGGKYRRPKSHPEEYEWAIRSHINLEKNINYFMCNNKFINKVCNTDSIRGFKLIEQVLDSIILSNQYIIKLKPSAITDTFINKYYKNYFDGKIENSDSLLIRHNFDRIIENCKSSKYFIYQRQQCFYEIRISMHNIYNNKPNISVNFLNGEFFYYATY